MSKQYVIITEFNEIYRHDGELPEQVLDGSEDGLYEIVDITDPHKPLRYWGCRVDAEGNIPDLGTEWVDLEELPKECKS